MAMTRVRSTLVAVVLTLTGGCSYSGGIEDAGTRKFQWFSYVDGEDIRATCTASSPDRYRVVYNAIYGEQVRMYEVDGLRKSLRVLVAGAGNAAAFDATDLLAPWRAGEERIQLDEAAWTRLTASFADSGMFAPPPVGLRLPAHSYFWTAAFCRDGRYGFTAWAYPSASWQRLAFPAALFALDPQSVAVKPAGPVPLDPQWENRRNRLEVSDFTLEVGPRGLK